MVPIGANKILAELRKSEKGSATFAELETRTGITYQKVLNLCDFLIDADLVRRGEKRECSSDYVVITPRGRYKRIYHFNAGVDFLVKSVIVPIAVTMITLWLEGVLSRIVELVQQLS